MNRQDRMRREKEKTRVSTHPLIRRRANHERIIKKFFKKYINVSSYYFCPGVAENPYDIADKPMEVDEGEEGEETMEDQKDSQGEEAGEEQNAEEETGGEQTDREKDSETDERGEDEGEGDEEEKEKGQEEGREEDKAVPADLGQKPKVCWSKMPTKRILPCVYFPKHDFFHLLLIRTKSGTGWRRRRRRMPSWSLPRERSTRRTGRPARRTFRATQRPSWQEPRPKETRPKRQVLPVYFLVRQQKDVTLSRFFFLFPVSLSGTRHRVGRRQSGRGARLHAGGQDELSDAETETDTGLRRFCC